MERRAYQSKASSGTENDRRGSVKQCFSSYVTGMTMNEQMDIQQPSHRFTTYLPTNFPPPLFSLRDGCNLLDAITKVRTKTGILLECEAPEGLFYLFASPSAVTQTGTEGEGRAALLIHSYYLGLYNSIFNRSDRLSWELSETNNGTRHGCPFAPGWMQCSVESAFTGLPIQNLLSFCFIFGSKCFFSPSHKKT